MNVFPPTRWAWVCFILGTLTLLLSLWLQGRMWLVVFGLEPVSAGGGEYLVALLLGLPALLLSLLLLGGTVVKAGWRSFLSWLIFLAALIPLGGFFVLFLKDIFSR